MADARRKPVGVFDSGLGGLTAVFQVGLLQHRGQIAMRLKLQADGIALAPV